MKIMHARLESLRVLAVGHPACALPPQERVPALLKKYDEEIHGVKMESFALGQFVWAHAHPQRLTVCTNWSPVACSVEMALNMCTHMCTMFWVGGLAGGFSGRCSTARLSVAYRDVVLFIK